MSIKPIKHITDDAMTDLYVNDKWRKMNQLLHHESVLRAKLNHVGFDIIHDPVDRSHRSSFVEDWDLDEIGISRHTFARITFPRPQFPVPLTEQPIWKTVEEYRKVMSSLEDDHDLTVHPPRLTNRSQQPVIVMGPSHLHPNTHDMKKSTSWFYRVFWVIMRNVRVVVNMVYELIGRTVKFFKS